MEFDLVTHKVKISSLNRKTAKVFITFLGEEDKRHLHAVLDAKELISIMKQALKRESVDSEEADIWNQLWQSEILRHEEDMEDISALVKEVRGMYKI